MLCLLFEVDNLDSSAEGSALVDLIVVGLNPLLGSSLLLSSLTCGDVLFVSVFSSVAIARGPIKARFFEQSGLYPFLAKVI